MAEPCKQRIWTTTTVTRIVARDNVCEFSTSCGDFTPKKATTLCIASSGPNLLYKIVFLWNHNVTIYQNFLKALLEISKHVFGCYCTLCYILLYSICFQPLRPSFTSYLLYLKWCMLHCAPHLAQMCTNVNYVTEVDIPQIPLRLIEINGCIKGNRLL